MISETIIKRLEKNNASWFANDNISEFLKDGELEILQQEVEKNVESLLRSLIIDTKNDHNTQQTARRMAKMYVKEVLCGRYQPMPQMTEFPNAKNLDEIYSLGPIKFKSLCSHHLAEMVGSCWVGIQPSNKVIGISKIARLVNWVARRGQIQEECVVIIADHLQEVLNPKGLGVVIRASHSCMTWRGVENEESVMVTSVVKGSFLEDHSAKEEFFDLIRSQGF